MNQNMRAAEKNTALLIARIKGEGAPIATLHDHNRADVIFDPIDLLRPQLVRKHFVQISE